MPKKSAAKKRREREKRRVAGGGTTRAKAGAASPIEPRVLRHRSLYGGRHEGELVYESDPDGQSVEHVYRRDATVADRLYRAGSLGDPVGLGRQLHDAAERFRRDFEQARLTGRLAAADLMRSGGGGQEEISDHSIGARERVRAALVSLGFAIGHERGSWTGKAAWWVLGVGMTLHEFAERMRWGGVPMSVDKASGMTISAIERLAIYYGIIGIKQAEQGQLRRAEGLGMIAAARSLERQAAGKLAEANRWRERREKLIEDGADAKALSALAAEILGHRGAAKSLRDAAEDLMKRGRRIAGGPPSPEPDPPPAQVAAAA